MADQSWLRRLHGKIFGTPQASTAVAASPSPPLMAAARKPRRFGTTTEAPPAQDRPPLGLSGEGPKPRGVSQAPDLVPAGFHRDAPLGMSTVDVPKHLGTQSDAESPPTRMGSASAHLSYAPQSSGNPGDKTSMGYDSQVQRDVDSQPKLKPTSKTNYNSYDPNDPFWWTRPDSQSKTHGSTVQYSEPGMPGNAHYGVTHYDPTASVDPNDPLTRGGLGTPLFMAPEVVAQTREMGGSEGAPLRKSGRAVFSGSVPQMAQGVAKLINKSGRLAKVHHLRDPKSGREWVSTVAHPGQEVLNTFEQALDAYLVCQQLVESLPALRPIPKRRKVAPGAGTAKRQRFDDLMQRIMQGPEEVA